MTALPGFEEFMPLVQDVVMTQPLVAQAIVDHFKPTGKILEPCEGDGAFSRAMPGCLVCEIRRGSDVYDWDEQVDWIVTNPPFSEYALFLYQAMDYAENIVFLSAANKLWNSDAMIKAVYKWGGVKEMLLLGTGSKMGFPVGFAVAATHYQRGYKGPITITRL